MNKYDLLIIGATAFGIAYATSDSKRTLLVERGITAGSDFVPSFQIHPINMNRAYTRQTLQLKQEMQERNILSQEGNLHIFPVSGILCSYLKQENNETLFSTEVLDIHPGNEGFVVTLYNLNGLTKIMARQIIDTTAAGVLHTRRHQATIKKSLCAMLANGKSAIASAKSHEINLIKGRFEDEVVLQLALDIHEEWSGARQKMHQCWVHIRNEFPDWELASVAMTFAYDFLDCPLGHSDDICEDWTWLPSVSYGDVLSAFEGGVLCATAI